jgi:hypothetical protein
VMTTKSHQQGQQCHELRDTNANIHYIISQLSHDKLETAARSSYEYMINPVPSLRNQYARKIVQSRTCLRESKANPQVSTRYWD